MTQKCNKLQAPLTISFIDFTKAFNSIHRQSLQNILQAYGIPSTAVTATASMNLKCCIRTKDGYSDRHDRNASRVFTFSSPFPNGHQLGVEASNTKKGHTVDGGEKNHV